MDNDWRYPVESIHKWHSEGFKMLHSCSTDHWHQDLRWLEPRPLEDVDAWMAGLRVLLWASNQRTLVEESSIPNQPGGRVAGWPASQASTQRGIFFLSGTVLRRSFSPVIAEQTGPSHSVTTSMLKHGKPLVVQSLHSASIAAWCESDMWAVEAKTPKWPCRELWTETSRMNHQGLIFAFPKSIVEHTLRKVHFREKSNSGIYFAFSLGS